MEGEGRQKPCKEINNALTFLDASWKLPHDPTWLRYVKTKTYILEVIIRYSRVIRQGKLDKSQDGIFGQDQDMLLFKESKGRVQMGSGSGTMVQKEWVQYHGS